LTERRGVAWLRERPFAHRGLHGGPEDLPENSLAAFEAAVAGGYGIELDVQRSRDHQAIVFHDATLDRLTGLSGRVAGHLATSLAQARIAGSAQTIPHLSQVLDLVDGRVPLLIEIKNRRYYRAGPLEAAVWELVRDYRGPCAILSFNPVTLGWYRRRAPALPRGQNTFRPNRARRLHGVATQPRLSRLMAEPDFISHEIETLSHRFASRVRAHGLPLLAWTVTSERERHKAELYADGYIFEGIRP
jgi:glycerophosphoryl diester phosphodiesterase